MQGICTCIVCVPGMTQHTLAGRYRSTVPCMTRHTLAEHYKAWVLVLEKHFLAITEFTYLLQVNTCWLLSVWAPGMTTHNWLFHTLNLATHFSKHIPK